MATTEFEDLCRDERGSRLSVALALSLADDFVIMIPVAFDINQAP